uniref:Uncharacterized protein n=1 Tax=Anopheles epiroticus TaxID=199890 RepID=A0A182PVC1_9DIPT
MSSLRKSASFRSRIPVRRTRLPHRRCTSPDHQQPAGTIGNSHGSESSIATALNDAEAGLFGKQPVGQQPKAWYDRSHCYSSSSYSSSDESYDSEAAPFQHLLHQSTVATSAGGPYERQQKPEQQQQQHRLLQPDHHPLSQRAHDHGDQPYQHFDHPFALLPHQHQPFATSSCLSTSTDAMSLDGLLDCVSTGTFSCPPSPKSKSYLDNGEADGGVGGRQSGYYESLEELNYALKTLIISDSFQAPRNNVLSAAVDGSISQTGTMECKDQFGASLEKRQQHRGELVSGQESVAPKHLQHEQQQQQQQQVLQPDQTVAEEDDDLIKQRKLSDWYYIKTAPTKKPTSPFERRRANGSRVANEAARRAGRIPPTLTPRASNPDIAGDERLLTKVSADSKHAPSRAVPGGELGDRKFPSPVPRPRRLPPTLPADAQPSWLQQHPGAVTKSASSSSVHLGLRGQLQPRAAASTRLHSNSDLQQAGTRKAIAPALLQDDSLGSLDPDSSSLAALGGSLAFEFTGDGDRERFSPYFRRRNPHPAAPPQWFPPPPPPPYHYPHQHHSGQREQRNIYENFPASANQHASMAGQMNNDEAAFGVEAFTPTARPRTTHPTGPPANVHLSTRPAPTLYGIEENEVFQYKVPLASGSSDRRPLPRPPIDTDSDEATEGQQQRGQPTEKKSSLTRVST